MTSINLLKLHQSHLNNILMKNILSESKKQLVQLSHIDCSAVCLSGIKVLKPLIKNSTYARQLTIVLRNIKNPITFSINYNKLHIHDFLFIRFLTNFFLFAHGKPFGAMKKWYDNNIAFISVLNEIYYDWKYLNLNKN